MKIIYVNCGVKNFFFQAFFSQMHELRIQLFRKRLSEKCARDNPKR